MRNLYKILTFCIKKINVCNPSLTLTKYEIFHKY